MAKRIDHLDVEKGELVLTDGRKMKVRAIVGVEFSPCISCNDGALYDVELDVEGAAISWKLPLCGRCKLTLEKVMR